ncbi:MAG: anti-sigma factor antagonist [Chitinivibrionales bacterium]|nr:anti-sigma factor antagonist [Chitinivibrionales bacterium]MBD3394418.1 anti-sigma factor antagonist [Chitinivibrionales bacterium]
MEGTANMGVKSVSVTSSIYDDGSAVVRVRGEIVTNLKATEIVRVVDVLMEDQSPPKIVISLDDLNYVDSYSFNWILSIYREIQDRGGLLAICDLNNDILELFQMTNFLKAVPVYATEEEARNALKSGDESGRIAR